MAEGNAGAGLIPVDVGRLSSGLQTMFSGMSEVFGSIGAGEQAMGVIAAAGQKASPADVPDIPVKPVEKQEKSAEKHTEEPAPKAAAQEPVKKTDITMPDIIKIVTSKIEADRSNSAKIGEIVKSFNIGKLSDLPENQYEAFLTQLTAL